VCVQNVTDLKGVACKLGYNSSVIQAVRVFPTSITSSATKWLPVDSSGVFHWDANPTINNTAYPPGNRSYLYQGLMPFCYVWINAWGFTPFTSPNPTVLSPVFNIEFEVMMTPPIETVTSPLNMCYCTPLDLFPYPSCELLNHNSVDIPFAPLDGCFCNIQPQHVIGWPTAVCSVYPSIVNVGSAVTFDGSASSDGGAPPLEYIWAITSGPTITTNSTTTTYTTSTPGTYTVTLTVVNKMGLNNTASPQSWTVVKPVGCITDLFTGPTRWCGQQTKFTGVGLANWTDYAQWLAGVAGAGNPLRNPGFVDALTPDVNLSLYTSVSFDGAPRANVLVAFQIIYEYALIDQSKGFPAGYDAINYTVDVRTAMTNTSGIAVTWFRIPMSMPGIPTWDGLPFGKWLVVATCKVQEVKQLDWIRFDVGYPVWITKVTTFNPVTKAAATTFSVGSSIGITVTAKNIMFIPKDVLLVCTVYDVCDVPIGYCFIALTASPATIYDTPHYFTENNTVVIPQWAYVGTPAYVYADAYTTWPVLLGEAYCPELSAIITITT
jgi:PKD repeat protein